MVTTQRNLHHYRGPGRNLAAITFDTGAKPHGPWTLSLQSSHLVFDLSALLLKGNLEVILKDRSRNKN